MAERVGWTREQQLVALRLYVRMPFGQLDQRNREIIAAAGQIGRTPGALAMKACNFASLDPSFRRTQRRGLTGTSAADRRLWEEFEANPEAIAAEAEEAFTRLDPAAAREDERGVEIPAGETDVLRLVRARRVQSFFRNAVLTSYGYRCALTDVAIPALLNASHIIPWSENVSRRADPRNGIALNVLYDRAFDRGLITFDEDGRLVVSRRLKDHDPPEFQRRALVEAEGKALRVPERFRWDARAMEWHRKEVFLS